MPEGLASCPIIENSFIYVKPFPPPAKALPGRQMAAEPFCPAEDGGAWFRRLDGGLPALHLLCVGVVSVLRRLCRENQRFLYGCGTGRFCRIGVLAAACLHRVSEVFFIKPLTKSEIIAILCVVPGMLLWLSW